MTHTIFVSVQQISRDYQTETMMHLSPNAKGNLNSRNSRRHMKHIPLTNRLLLKFADLRSAVLEHLTNLRALEFTGRTTQVGISITRPENQPMPSTPLHPSLVFDEPANSLDLEWRKVHHNSLENLLRLIYLYYRTLYPHPALHTMVENLFVEDMFHDLPTKPPATPDDTAEPDNSELQDRIDYEVQNREYSLPALDIRALEQLAADRLVDVFYRDPEISQDAMGFGMYARVLSNAWYTPLFESTEAEFFLLVCNTFHEDPRRNGEAVSEAWD